MATIHIGKYILRDDRSIGQSLTQIFGLGSSKTSRIVKFLGVKPNLRIRNLPPDSKVQLGQFVDMLAVEQPLRIRLYRLIRRQDRIRSYKSIRKAVGLPCRGQRTHTNASTFQSLRKVGKHLPIKIVQPRETPDTTKRFGKNLKKSVKMIKRKKPKAKVKGKKK